MGVRARKDRQTSLIHRYFSTMFVYVNSQNERLKENVVCVKKINKQYKFKSKISKNYIYIYI